MGTWLLTKHGESLVCIAASALAADTGYSHAYGLVAMAEKFRLEPLPADHLPPDVPLYRFRREPDPRPIGWASQLPRPMEWRLSVQGRPVARFRAGFARFDEAHAQDIAFQYITHSSTYRLDRLAGPEASSDDTAEFEPCETCAGWRVPGDAHLCGEDVPGVTERREAVEIRQARTWALVSGAWTFARGATVLALGVSGLASVIWDGLLVLQSVTFLLALGFAITDLRDGAGLVKAGTAGLPASPSPRPRTTPTLEATR